MFLTALYYHPEYGKFAVEIQLSQDDSAHLQIANFYAGAMWTPEALGYICYQRCLGSVGWAIGIPLVIERAKRFVEVMVLTGIRFREISVRRRSRFRLPTFV